LRIRIEIEIAAINLKLATINADYMNGLSVCACVRICR